MAEVKKENWFKRTWGKVKKYFRELRSELKKVVWPTPQQVLKNASLLGLVVSGVLLAESAILLHFETVRVVLLVLHGVVVSLLALGASHSDFHAHNGTSLKLPPCITPPSKKFRKRSTTITARS